MLIASEPPERIGLDRRRALQSGEPVLPGPAFPPIPRPLNQWPVYATISRGAPGCCGALPGAIPCSPLPDPWKSVHYISTRDRRSRPERLSFGEMLLAGLARDGGLYVPAEWPHFDADRVRALAGRSYAEIAVAVIAPFIGEEIEAAALDRLVDAAYAGFGHAAVAPLKQLAPDLWLLELVHGPTLPSATPCACRRSIRSTGRASWPRRSITSSLRSRWARPTARWASVCRPEISATFSPRMWRGAWACRSPS